MRKAMLACIASAAFLLSLAAAGAASAAPPGQDIGQSAESQQLAGSSATSVQDHPTNSNISVRIGSPGDDGAVTQSNSSAASSAAGNSNATSQSAAQAGSGGQAIDQSAKNAQAALSAAESVQEAPKNENISVRIHSAGDDGAVQQSNDSSAQSAAGNTNKTDQEAAQVASGGSGTQAIGQDAASKQLAGSLGASAQDHPVNANTPVRIGSAGDDGAVSQSNRSHASSAAGNTNHTSQEAAQSGGPPSDMMSSACGACRSYHGGVQAIGQDAANWQAAKSVALSAQEYPLNANAGGSGAVSQKNSSEASSASGNSNATTQDADQSAGGKAGTPVQAIGQDASNAQLAKSVGVSLQDRPANVNGGGGGAVEQSNSSKSSSSAGNSNATEQNAEQSAPHSAAPTTASRACEACGHGYGPVVQAIGQDAVNHQLAWSDALSAQICPLNENWWWYGDPKKHDWKYDPKEKEKDRYPVPMDALGALEQANDSAAYSSSGNENGTRQDASQEA